MDVLLQVVAVLLLGALQGFGEVLPVSSSGHQAIVSEILSLDSYTLALATALHAGSLLAIVIWFRYDLWALWRTFRCSWSKPGFWSLGSLTSPDAQLREYYVPYYMAISLVPTALLGLWLKGYAQAFFLNGVWVLPLLFLNGLAILATASWTRGEKTLGMLGVGDYVLIGLIHGLAVIPGISRLGAVLCAGLWCKLNWYEAVRLSFVLAIPVIAGGILVQFGELVQQVSQLVATFGIFRTTLGLGLGFMAAFVTSWFGLKILMSHGLLGRRNLVFYGAYCCMLGIFAFLYLSMRWR